MKTMLLAAWAGALLTAGVAAAAGGQSASPTTSAPTDEDARLKAEADARFERLRAQNAAEVEARREAQERYEQSVRDAEAARLQFEADSARHQADVARARAAEEEYQQQRVEYERQVSGGRSVARPERERRSASAANTSPGQCEQRQQRGRNRGRAVGGALGGLAGGLVGRNGNRLVGLVAGAAIGTVLGDAISRLLDCDEQVQAAGATERALEGGVGTTETWTSETRSGVTGSSTVLAVERGEGNSECLTVTDVVIIDGEETRAPKRMCRQPPSTRFVRV